jgi:hypothetical protein
MPDIRKHRGAHPEDQKLFAGDQLPMLRCAVGDLSWLLTRGYPMKAAVKLTGDRYLLTERQRLALSRAACSDQSRNKRAAARIRAEHVIDQGVIIDGFNVIITVEAALSYGVLMNCRDGCIRDLSSVHGSYRSVDETDKAILLIGQALDKLKPGSVRWLLDRPISNSGRLAKRIRETAAQHGWNWIVDPMFNPDAEIIQSQEIVISSDSHVLDRIGRWTNFARYLLNDSLKDFWLIDLSG